MINLFEVKETNEMIEKENLDVRTITLGISLMDCIDSNLDKLNRKIYDKITTTARNLVSVGEEIEGEFGIPIVNKRISVTPIALVGAAACRTPEDFSDDCAGIFQHDDGNGRLQEREIQRRACKRSGGAWKFHRRCHPLPA